jgi:hypothetical protein
MKTATELVARLPKPAKVRTPEYSVLHALLRSIAGSLSGLPPERQLELLESSLDEIHVRTVYVRERVREERRGGVPTPRKDRQ